MEELPCYTLVPGEVAPNLPKEMFNIMVFH